MSEAAIDKIRARAEDLNDKVSISEDLIRH